MDEFPVVDIDSPARDADEPNSRVAPRRVDVLATGNSSTISLRAHAPRLLIGTLCMHPDSSYSPIAQKPQVMHRIDRGLPVGCGEILLRALSGHGNRPQLRPKNIAAVDYSAHRTVEHRGHQHALAGRKTRWGCRPHRNPGSSRCSRWTPRQLRLPPRSPPSANDHHIRRRGAPWNGPARWPTRSASWWPPYGTLDDAGSKRPGSASSSPARPPGAVPPSGRSF